MRRDRPSIAAWNVATIGPSADQHAIIERLGVTGECTCSTSKSPSRIHRLTRDAERGPNSTRATEPLYGTGTARPAMRHVVGHRLGLLARREDRDLEPQGPRAPRARSCTWIATPLGTFQS